MKGLNFTFIKKWGKCVNIQSKKYAQEYNWYIYKTITRNWLKRFEGAIRTKWLTVDDSLKRNRIIEHENR